MSNVIFVDRDGVINEDPIGDYIKRPQDFKFIAGALEALRALSKAQYEIVIISNQAGVGDGEFDSEALDEVTEVMMRGLIANQSPAAGVFYCLHGKQAGCDCRKPKVGLFKKAAKAFSFNPAETYFIGDKVSDVEAGKRFGLKTAFVLTGHGKDHKKQLSADEFPDFIAADLKEAVARILTEKTSNRKA